VFGSAKSHGSEDSGCPSFSLVLVGRIKKHGPLAAVLLLTVLVRVLQLDLFYGRDELTIWRWSDEFFVSLWHGDLANLVLDSDYPGITIYWLQSFYNYLKYGFLWFTSGQVPTLEAIVDEPHSLPYLAERRLVMGLATTAQILGIYALAARAYNRRLALLMAFLIALDPFLLAESRVLRAEALAAGFMILSMMSWLVYLKEGNWGYLALSGVLAGWAILTKVSSGFLVPVIGLLFLFDVVLSRKGTWWMRIKLNAKRGVIWGGLAVVTFWVSWPTLWVNPSPPLETIFVRSIAQASQASTWSGDVFFTGRLIPNDPGLLFYPVAIAFRSTPLIWLGVGVALILFLRGLLQIGRPAESRVAGASTDEDGPWSVVNLGVWFVYSGVIFVGLSLTLSKVDRYLLPIFPALSILAALGLGWIFDWIGRKTSNSRWIENGGVLSICVGQLALTLISYPYFYSYWNPLLGGGAAAVRTLPVGSGEGLDKALEVVNQQPDAERLTLICGASRAWCEGKFVGTTWSYEVLNSSEWMQADYVLPYINWSQRQMYPQGVLDYLSRQQPVYQAELGGATYAWLYRVPEVSHFSGTKLEGRGTLYGYDLSGAELQAGDVLTATLYWRNEGQQPADRFFVRIEDAADYPWATAYAQPRVGFEEAAGTRKEIVESEVSLTLPIGMPPGHYFLKMGFVTDGGETLVGRFELPDDGDDVLVTPPDTFPEADEVMVPHGLDLVTDGVTLMGYDLRPGMVEAGEKGWLTLYWRAEQNGPRDYVVGIRLLSLDGDEVTYWLGRPVYSGYPTSEWVEGQVVQDPWELWMPEEVPPGDYELELVLFDGVTGEPAVRALLAPWSVTSPLR
jgi:4-amino-4-deoxy-L-arabinose transferase-like glycosyltransferase